MTFRGRCASELEQTFVFLIRVCSYLLLVVLVVVLFILLVTEREGARNQGDSYDWLSAS